ncbi:MAG: hypothetical protein WD231_03170 [Candidatus Woykebacteria bacterium]
MKLFNIDLKNLKALAVPALIAVTILVIIPFVILPLLRNVRETNNSLNNDRERLRNLSNKLGTLNSLDEAEINQKLSEANIALPAGKQVAPLVVGLQNLALGSNLAVDEISLTPGKVSTESAKAATASATAAQTQPAAPSGQLSKDSLILKLSLSGSVSSLEAFLEKLEMAKRISSIDSLAATDSEGSKFQILFQLSIPFRPVEFSSDDLAAEQIPALSADNERTLLLIDKFINFTDIQIQEGRTGVANPFGN